MLLGWVEKGVSPPLTWWVASIGPSSQAVRSCPASAAATTGPEQRAAVAAVVPPAVGIRGRKNHPPAVRAVLPRAKQQESHQWCKGITGFTGEKPHN